MAERGIEVSYETIRCWTLKFGGLFAHNLWRGSPTAAQWRKTSGSRGFLSALSSSDRIFG